MASTDDLDLDIESEKKPPNWLLIGIIAVVVLGGSIGGVLFFVLGEDSEEDVGSSETSAADAKSIEITSAAVYHSFDEPLIVNYTDGRRARYARIEISLMTRNDDALELFLTHEPGIKHTMLKYLMGTNLDDVSSAEGQMQLAEELTALVKTHMKELVGDDSLERVLITGFLVQ